MIVVLCDFHRLQGKLRAVFFTSFRHYHSQFISALYNYVMSLFVIQNFAVHMAQFDTLQGIPYFAFNLSLYFSWPSHMFVGIF